MLPPPPPRRPGGGGITVAITFPSFMFFCMLKAPPLQKTRKFCAVLPAIEHGGVQHVAVAHETGGGAGTHIPGCKNQYTADGPNSSGISQIIHIADAHPLPRRRQQRILLTVLHCCAQGMEVYSTVLWHMKREVELGHLAQEAVALDRKSPWAWAIMGNCFSLQKEHDAAIRLFQRGLQLDSTFVYAYTLSGHEYFANEDFDKGMACFRNAIRLDPRHYNAWCARYPVSYRWTMQTLHGKI